MNRSVHPLLAVLLAAALSSCQVEQAAPSVYQYRFEIADDASRAELYEEGVYWQDGDRVSLYLGNNGPVQAAVDASASPKTIVFSTGKPVAAGTAVNACYPYREGSSTVSAAPVVIPSAQQGFQVSAMPMAGVPTAVSSGSGNSGRIYFLNLGAIIDFRVFSQDFAGEKVESILLRADAGGPVSGEAKLNLNNVDPQNASTLNLNWSGGVGYPYVSLRQPAVVAADKATAAQEHLYLVLAPGTYSGTITVVTDAAVYSFPFMDKSFPRNTVMRYNLNLTQANRQAPFNLENDRVKAYLDKVESAPYDPADYSYTYIEEFCTGVSEDNRLDWPAPVTVRWINPASGNGAKQILVYNDPAMTDLELSVSAQSGVTAAAVYNLIPGRAYYYKVMNGTRLLTNGAFRTTGRRRFMRVDDTRFHMNNAVNCRDFGGQVTVSGKKLRYGKIFRGSNMDATSDAAKDILLNYMHIGLDVDLRKPPGSSNTFGECIYDGLGLGEWHLTEPYDSWAELTNPAKMGGTLNRIFDVVNDPDCDRVVYVHCKVGADRTGFVCMLLQACLGVPLGWCDVDYEMTAFAGNAVNDNPRTRTGHGNYYYLTKTEKNWWGQVTSTEVRGVDYIKTLPGDTYQDKTIYFLTEKIGIAPETITAFQNAMLE